MGWFDKVTLAEKNRRIDVLEENIRILEDRIRAMNAEKQDNLVKEMANASFAIDWEAMNVFSVERMWDNGIPKTILGYILEEPVVYTEGDDQRVTHKDVVREWTLYCSAEKHEELVKQFKDWLNK